MTKSYITKTHRAWLKPLIGILVAGLSCCVLWLGLRFLFWKLFAVPIVNSIAYSPDGKTLAGAGGWLVAHDGDDLGGALWIWDSRNGALRQRLTGRFNVLQAVAFSTDGSTVAGWQSDGRRLLWNVETGQRRNTTEASPTHEVNRDYRDGETTDAALPFIPSPSGHRIAKAGDMSARKLKMASVQRVLDKHPDETFLALSTGGVMMVNNKWNEKTQASAVVLRALPGGEVLQTFPEKISSARLVKFSPDDALIALQHHGGFSPSALYLWDVRQRELRHTLQNEVAFARSLAFSPDGKTLAESGGYGEVAVWEVSTGKVLDQWNAG